MSNTRLTVVVRKDLQLSAGLLAAQVAHVAMEFIRGHTIDSKILPKDKGVDVHFSDIERNWIVSPYISVLAVHCLEDLDAIIEHTKSEGLEYAIWEDTIPSPTFEGKAIKALVAIAIGPADFDAIKIVTNGLELY